jgi:hypothetical protein
MTPPAATSAGPSRKERLALAGLVLYVLAILVVLSPAGEALGVGASGSPPTPGAVSDPADPVAGGSVAVPELTEAQQEHAVGLARASAAFRRVVAGRPFSIARIGPWTTAGEPQRLLGVSLEVAFPAAVELRGAALPGALYDVTERRSPPYQEVVNRVDARNVRTLMVLVDLEQGRVVNISPGPDAEILSSTPPPGFQRTVPMPRDGGVAERGSQP